jgi:hypothetical protein
MGSDDIVSKTEGNRDGMISKGSRPKHER